MAVRDAESTPSSNNQNMPQQTKAAIFDTEETSRIYQPALVDQYNASSIGNTAQRYSEGPVQAFMG